MNYRTVQIKENEENEKQKKLKTLSFEKIGYDKSVQLKKEQDEHYKKYIFYRNLKNAILKDTCKKERTR